MRAILGLIIGLLLEFAIQIDTNSDELEIYTLENIYYIDGLIVTNENDDTVITFKSKDKLVEYISDKTANDNQEGYDCLMSK